MAKKLKTFKVDVQRVSYSRFRTITVEATSARAAALKAVDVAGDFEYSEDSAEYEVDSIEEVV